jgi:hypothetical protein
MSTCLLCTVQYLDNNIHPNITAPRNLFQPVTARPHSPGVDLPMGIPVTDQGDRPYGLGRWSYMMLTGKGNRKVVIVTAYRVCSATVGTSGDCTAYMQQFRSLLAYNNDNKITNTIPKPNQQFVLDLQAWIEMLQADGASIILSLDANEDTLTTEPIYHPLPYQEGRFIDAPPHNDHLSSLNITCGLVDTLSHLHPPPYPSTYHRGTNRLDIS